QQELEPQVHNLVGFQLDHFRHEGTAQLEDKHIGQDPFQHPLPPVSQKSDVAPATDEDQSAPAANLSWKKPVDAAPSTATPTTQTRTPPPPAQKEAKDAKATRDKDAKDKRVRGKPASASPQPQQGLPAATQKQTPEQLQKAIDALVASGVIGADQAKS